MSDDRNRPDLPASDPSRHDTERLGGAGENGEAPHASDATREFPRYAGAGSAEQAGAADRTDAATPIPVPPAGSEEPTPHAPAAPESAPQSAQHDQQQDQQPGGPFAAPRFPAAGQQAGSYPSGTAHPFGPPPSTTVGGSGGKKRKRAVVGIAAVALVVGAAGGLGGSAAWDALHPSQTVAADSGGNGTQLQSTSAAAPISVPDGSAQKAAAAVLPSVVKIVVQTSSAEEAGSGIVLTANGLIATNNHVVADAASDASGQQQQQQQQDPFGQEDPFGNGNGNSGRSGTTTPTITVIDNAGKTYKATIVGRDPLTDLAVIRAAGATAMKPATLGGSGNLQVGQSVLAIGSPLGLQSTVTSGIVSALDRPVTAGESADSTTVFPAVQTDAAINPGNSGGALINLSGQVVGINSAIQTASSGSGQQGSNGNIGLGFAIGMDQAKPIINQLIAKGVAAHAVMGVKVSSGSGDELTSGVSTGVPVQVTAGGAAAKAGLQTNDVVTSIAGQRMTSSEQLIATVRAQQPGDSVTVIYTRGGQSHTVKVALGTDNGVTTTH